MHSDIAFTAADYAIVRLSMLPFLDITGEHLTELTTDDDVRRCLDDVANNPVLYDMLQVSSESLIQILDKIRSGSQVKSASARRAAYTVLRYLYRASSRPTPYGLMAGVTSARFGGKTQVKLGTNHRKHMRPDREWLLKLTREWEMDGDVLPSLRLVANDLCTVRGGRLVVPFFCDGKVDGLGENENAERSVKYNDFVRRALEYATEPIAYDDLCAQLRSAYPDARGASITRALNVLVEQEFLLSDLRPPLSAEDPLKYVVDRLRTVSVGARGERLSELHDIMRKYERTPLGSGRESWRLASSSMRRFADARTLFHVDVRMDAQIELPSTVRDELASAATLAWRLAADDFAPYDPLPDYRAAFIDRYGLDATVAIKELLDPQTGLGAPADYIMPPDDRQSLSRVGRPDDSRDRILSEMAQRSAAHGFRELVLDDDTIGSLARRDAAPAFYIESRFQILANSTSDLDRGNYRLVLEQQQFTRPAAMFGRFLAAVPELHDPVRTLIDGMSGPGDDAIPVQLIYSPIRARTGNVLQVPKMTDYAINVGCFTDRPRNKVLRLDDIYIGATTDRLFAVSASLGREIVPLTCHAHNTRSASNVVRLLAEIGEYRTPLWMLWDWNMTGRLMPFTPRIRYGRTILNSARWRPEKALANSSASDREWNTRFMEWCATWHVPDSIYVERSDHRIQLDTNSLTDRRVLREELVKHPDTILVEDPADAEFGRGWIGGHANEVVIPLLPRTGLGPRSTEAPSGVRAPRPGTRHHLERHMPGSEWTFLKLYSRAVLHNAIIVDDLPPLLERLDGLTDRWFFARYRDDGAHIRLRFHSHSRELGHDLIGIVGEWATELARQGVINDFSLNTYHPEIDRYGGPQAIAAAEEVFHADSVSAIEQLGLYRDAGLGVDMDLLTAANVMDLAHRLMPRSWRGWLLDTFAKNEHHRAFQRSRDAAMSLLCPTAAWQELRRGGKGELLHASWERRAGAVARYGDTIRRLTPAGQPAATSAFASILHMNHNRLAGIDREAEMRSHAIARGVLAVHRDRERHLARRASSAGT
jgi:thiopeptide-type bacteriocin biosynthesis protein